MRIFLLIQVISLPGLANAQHQKKDSRDPERLSKKAYNLIAKKAASPELKLPFSSITVIDSRFDTSKFGFTAGFWGGRKETFQGGVAKAIENYYKDYYKNAFTDNGLNLVIIMKRYWESKIDYTRTQNLEIMPPAFGEGYTYLKWEYCLEKDGQYLPVKRMDTIIRRNEELNNVGEDMLEENKLGYEKIILKLMIEKNDFTRAVAAFDNQTKKTFDEITAFNNKRYQLPVLQTDTFVKGVYLSFTDFKNNKPSIINFKVKKMNYGFMRQERFLTTMDGETITDYWGYADEDGFRYGKYGNDMIFRIGNTFQFFVETKQVVYDNSSQVTTKNTRRTNMPYQIDMETGLVY
jgi:hypothetical protein